MSRYRTIAAAAAVGVILVSTVRAQQASHEHTPAVAAKDPVAAARELSAARFRFSPELQKIKSLAGRWEGTTFREREGTNPAVVTYEVTAGGSAVIERLFPGTAREMTTLYHDDSSGRLMATH